MIRAAIVGLGRWGRLLVEAVQGQSAAIRFVAGVTRTPARAEAFCAEHGIALGADYAAVLGDPTIDAVVLATPHTLHAEQIVAAARAGKHVFTEKPFTLTRASAEAAVAACAEAGVALGLGHNRRFMPNTRALKGMVAEGALGTLLHAEANFSADLAPAAGKWRASRTESPAGGMTSLGIHALDCLIHLCGPIAEVDARSLRRALPFDIDDTTAALFAFANGMTGTLATIAATPYLWHVRLFGDTQWAEIRGHDTLTVCGPDNEERIERFPRAAGYPHDDSIRAELEAFAAAAAGGPAYPIAPSEMVHGIAVLEAIAKSAETGARVAVA